MTQFFGTDGIRGRVGTYPITPDFVLKLAWAAGQVFKNQGRTRVLIGKDTRVSGYMFESALEAGFIAAGVEVLLTGPMPTPAIAYLTKTLHAQAGVVISASHNPHEDNGIKFFDGEGQKLSPTMEAAIEEWLAKPMTTAASKALGRASRLNDAPGRYIEFCKSTFRPAKTLQGLKIVLDMANGATYHIAPAVFDELGAEVVLIGHQPNGLNINQNCGATDLAALQQRVLQTSADLGIAFDGDGDRVMMVDAEGSIVDGDTLLYILAVGAEEKPQGVVGTLMSNHGLALALAKEGIAFVRANVGDKYVLAELKERHWCYGAEPSGHVLTLDQSSTGDGIVAALQVLKILQLKNWRLEEMRKAYEPLPQILVNVTVKDKKAAMEKPAIKQKIKEIQNNLGDEGRILVRPSGTEPKVRIMLEGRDYLAMKAQAEELQALFVAE